MPPRPHSDPARRADARRNRVRVLDAARALFATDGVDVPLDAIARLAGVGAGTVHRHFLSKDALLSEIVVSDLKRRVAATRRRLTAPDPGDALFALLRGLLDDGRANAALKAALADSGFELAAVRADAFLELHGVFADALSAAQRAGAVRPDIDVDEVKAVLAAALTAQSHPSVAAAREEHVREIVLAGLRALPPTTRRNRR